MTRPCRAEASGCGCVQPAKPGVVATAESSAQEVSEDMVDTMEAYNMALGRYVRLVRDTLPLYGGYECKEPEPGKFTLAFPCGPPLPHTPDVSMLSTCARYALSGWPCPAYLARCTA